MGRWEDGEVGKVNSNGKIRQMVPVKIQLTLQEFLALPEEDITYELVDGEAQPKMSPKRFHSRLIGALYFPHATSYCPCFPLCRSRLFSDKKKVILGLTCSKTWSLTAVSIPSKVSIFSGGVFLYKIEPIS